MSDQHLTAEEISRWLTEQHADSIYDGFSDSMYGKAAARIAELERELDHQKSETQIALAQRDAVPATEGQPELMREADDDLFHTAEAWAQQYIPNARSHSTTVTRARAIEAYIAGHNATSSLPLTVPANDAKRVVHHADCYIHAGPNPGCNCGAGAASLPPNDDYMRIEFLEHSLARNCARGYHQYCPIFLNGTSIRSEIDRQISDKMSRLQDDHRYLSYAGTEICRTCGLLEREHAPEHRPSPVETAAPPCVHPWENIGISAEGNYYCTNCATNLVKEPPFAPGPPTEYFDLNRANALAEAILQSVCENPDHTSPDDDPELLLCYPADLRSYVVSALETEFEFRTGRSCTEQPAETAAPPDCPHCDGFLMDGIVRHSPKCPAVETGEAQ